MLDDGLDLNSTAVCRAQEIHQHQHAFLARHDLHDDGVQSVEDASGYALTGVAGARSLEMTCTPPGAEERADFPMASSGTVGHLLPKWTIPLTPGA